MTGVYVYVLTTFTVESVYCLLRNKRRCAAVIADNVVYTHVHINAYQNRFSGVNISIGYEAQQMLILLKAHNNITKSEQMQCPTTNEFQNLIRIPA